jgi:hypothetical protein
MGIFARLFGWLWRRWGDWQSVVALLDLLDFKTAIFGFLGFLAMTFYGATNMDWSPPAVLLAALAAGALVSIILVAVRMLFWPVAIQGNVASGAGNVGESRALRRPIPITPDSIYSFLNGYPIVRETDHAIASDLGLQMEEEHFPADALVNAVQHFGVASLADLETLLREHRETVIGLSRYFRPKGSGGKPAKITRGHSVHMLLEVLAARTGSIDKYMDYARAIGASCGTGFAENVIDAYREICPDSHL